MPARIEPIEVRLARVLVDLMDEHGGVSEFADKLAAFPEQYSLDLAIEAISYLQTSTICPIEKCKSRAAQAELDAYGVKI